MSDQKIVIDKIICPQCDKELLKCGENGCVLKQGDALLVPLSTPKKKPTSAAQTGQALIVLSLVTLIMIFYLNLSAGGSWGDIGLQGAAIALLAAGIIIAVIIWVLKKFQAITGK